ncbi:hypothetical protein EV186_102171 [Labedaea rhizosphaerae]|uniref:Uncharacterized protein n=1 Tax=Labedaea rhizosphaerae TaxID=598644 RepID=A0A4R6SFM8_LABRH|nr:hypothetical protein EV186_102171 [Labedaea rhizosphaerae]
MRFGRTDYPSDTIARYPIRPPRTSYFLGTVFDELDSTASVTGRDTGASVFHFTVATTSRYSAAAMLVPSCARLARSNSATAASNTARCWPGGIAL